jgi:DNA-binding response OmpR family regulator
MVTDNRLFARFRDRELGALKAGRVAALAWVRGQQRRENIARNPADAVWARAFVAKLLFLLGRRREAMGVAAEALQICQDRAVPELRSLVDSSLAHDPLGDDWLRRDLVPCETDASDVIRARVHAALRRVCARQAARHELAIVSVPGGADYALDRAILEVARSRCALRCRQRRLATRHLGCALAEAASCGADPDLILDLNHRAQQAELNAATIAASGAPADTLVINTELHEVRDGSRSICLAYRLVLRRLLYAFALAPGRYLNRDEIALTLWGSNYDPLRHASSVKSNIRRLRELLDGTRAVLQTDIDGYSLALPANAVVITPKSMIGGEVRGRRAASAASA